MEDSLRLRPFNYSRCRTHERVYTNECLSFAFTVSEEISLLVHNCVVRLMSSSLIFIDQQWPLILGSGTGPPSLHLCHNSSLMVQTSEMASNMPRETRNLTEDPDSVQACSGLATDYTENLSVGRY